MNIVKLQNELKSVPDQALIGYVQNPTGQVPSYLALSELQRRKDMRTKYQKAQPEAPSVAEELTQPQVQPDGLAMLAKNPIPQGAPTEQGLAGLPTGDMYDEKNFATGGIVAFAGGGTPEDRTFGQDFNVMQRYMQNLPSHLLRPFMELAAKTSAENAYQTLTKNYPSMPKTIFPETSAVSSTAPTAVTGGPRVDTTQLPQSFTGIGTQSQFGVSPGTINQMGAAPQAPVAKAAGPDFGGLYQPLKDYSSEFAALQQSPTGVAESEMARYKQLIGDDEFRPKLVEKLKKMEERSAKAEEQAPWMALARAGLGMAAGKSPFALQNIAEGATMGLEDYNKAKDKLENARDKQFDLQAKIAQAQRAEQIAAATHGIQSEQHIKAQNHSTKLAELGYKANREAANQKNKIDAFEAVNKGKLYGAQAEYYSEKGPSGEITEKALFDKYITSGGEIVNGPWEAFKQKYGAKPIPQDVNNLVSKYLK